MTPEGEKPPTKEQFEKFAQALMQVSKEELAEVIAAEERERKENPGPRRGRPSKKSR